MQRREFLQATLGAAASTMPMAAQASARDQDRRPTWLTMYDETLAASTDLELLGIPKSWWHVHHGLHPFSPERVILLPNRPNSPKTQELRQQLYAKFGSQPGTNSWDEEASVYLIHLAYKLAQVYRVPEHAETWARVAVGLHMMGANWFHRGLGLVVNLQRYYHPGSPFTERVPVRNGLLDWWLVLMPDGFETKGILDPGRTHVLIIPIYSAGQPHDHWRYCGLIEDLHRHIIQTYDGNQQALWANLSQMNRKQACLFLNRHVAEMIHQRQGG